MSADPFRNHRDAALALLHGDNNLTWKAGSFLGQLVVTPERPPTDKQRDWLAKLLDRAGLPPLAGDA